MIVWPETPVMDEDDVEWLRCQGVPLRPHPNDEDEE